MRFGRTPEQTAFAEALDDLLAGAGVPAVARSWASGEHAPGLELWRRIAELGVTGLLVPEEHDGLSATFADVAIAFERLGHHGVPGPWIETAAVAPGLLTDPDDAKLLRRIAAGEALVSVAIPPEVPYALDADVAEQTLLVKDGRALKAEPSDQLPSLDPTRHLFTCHPAESAHLAPQNAPSRLILTPLDAGALACAAWLLGAGTRLLEDSVAYAGQRTQFGRPIGEYQALKHLLADVRVALDFARPLVHFAALHLDAGSALAARDVSAAKVAASEAAYLASRTALQVHGAIGYTQEFDLSLWILKVRALVSAWGTPAEHRARVLDSLVAGGTP